MKLILECVDVILKSKNCLPVTDKIIKNIIKLDLMPFFLLGLPGNCGHPYGLWDSPENSPRRRI